MSFFVVVNGPAPMRLGPFETVEQADEVAEDVKSDPLLVVESVEIVRE
jgi:hypothetical protein